jgi:hypothetical protein
VSAVRFRPEPPFVLKLNKNYGDCGEVVNAPDCGSGIRGFDSHQSPHFKLLAGVVYW